MVVLGTTGFSQSISYCPTIQYTFIDTGTGTTPSSIFSIVGSNIQVYSNSPIDIGTYNLALTGTIYS